METAEPNSTSEVANKFAPTAEPTTRHGHRALRRYRVSLPYRTYFVTACTHRRRPLFESGAVANLVFGQLHSVETANGAVALVASVVMPDHVHVVFALAEGSALESVMKRFRGAAAQGVNRALGRTGPVWQRGYFDRLLRAEERLEPVLHYMWHNPVTPGMNFRCRRETWEWFRTCVRNKPDYYEWLKQNP